MPRDTEMTVMFLHQVRPGDLFYSGPSEARAWMRECYDEGPRRELVEVPVQRRGLHTHMNGMTQVWVRRADGTGR
jgi:hypothetical protein